jgi:hypothetical protein
LVASGALFGAGCISQPPSASHPEDLGLDAQSTFDARLDRDASTDIAQLDGERAVSDSSLTDSTRAPGAVIYYTFAAGSGVRIQDQSGIGPDVDLEIEDTGVATWSDEGLTLESPGTRLTGDESSKLYDRCSESDQITLEAWVTAGRKNADGPDRIFAYSENPRAANFMIGQTGLPSGDRFVFRLRTEDAGDIGEPGVYLRPSVELEPTHIALTYSPGVLRTFQNGSEVEHDLHGQGAHELPLDWDSTYRLIAGDEYGANQETDRHWVGTLHLLAVYCRVLTSEEISKNYEAGF